jgi:muramoyltetrapeptide carboxypeptidase LdcA involved in peptidoglycan recycling
METLPPVRPGDQVAVISPSAGLPAVFPAVYELGLKRLRDVFQLHPIEYPTTRVMNAPLKDRARDMMAAFADPDNKAVFTSIGGIDQIQLLKRLDPEVFRSNPKPFFGYSDNTHLLNFLWQLDIPSFYGCAVMVQLGMHGSMFEMTVDSLKQALFTRGPIEMQASPIFNDVGLDWSNEALLSEHRITESNEGWYWDGFGRVQGKLWGGCAESFIPILGSNRWVPKDEQMDDAVLYLETSEDLPAAWIVQYVLIAMGERGWLDRIAGVLVGRAKAWEFDKQKSADEKVAYKAEQRDIVIQTVRQYNPTAPIVQNLDFGHTDPQVMIPSGQQAAIDCSAQSITMDFG